MGLLGHIAAGALQGLGSGLVAEATLRRNQALEELRQQALAQRETLADERQTARETRGYTEQEKRDRRLHDQQIDVIGAQGSQRIREIGVSGNIDAANAAARDERLHGYRREEITWQQQSAAELAEQASRLRRGETAEEIRLRDQLSSGEIQTTVRGSDGMLYGITRNGQRINTGVPVIPEGAGSAAASGGRHNYTNDQIETIHADRVRAVRAARQPIPTMEQTIASLNGGGGSAPGGRVIQYDANGNRVTR